MPYIYASAWFEPHGNYNDDANNSHCYEPWYQSDNNKTIYRKHKGSRGRKKYHCVHVKYDHNGKRVINDTFKTLPTDNRDFIRWDNNNGGAHPCKGVGESKLYFQNRNGFDGDMGFRCTVPDNKVHSWIKANSSHANSINARDGNNNTKNMRDQLLFGGAMKAGQIGTGFCAKKENLALNIGPEGTCFDILAGKQGKAVAEQRARDYCRETDDGRRDPMCRCINVSGSGFIKNCKKHKWWAGCDQINARVKELETLMKKTKNNILSEDDFGSADCIQPGICEGNVYNPLANSLACAKTMNVCNQVMNMENVKAFDGLQAVQKCGIDFAGEHDKREKAKNDARIAEENRLIQERKDKNAAIAKAEAERLRKIEREEDQRLANEKEIREYEQNQEKKKMMITGGTTAGVVLSSSSCMLVLILMG